MPAGLSAQVMSPSRPFAPSTSASALALVSLYASIGIAGKSSLSSTSTTSSVPEKTTPAEEVKTSFLIPFLTHVAMTVRVPTMLTFS